MTAATATTTYRKTKSGEWVVYGPADMFREQIMTPGGPDTILADEVTVTKRDGSTKTERIEHYGKPFRVEGVEMVYGYIARTAPRSASRRGKAGICDECGQPRRNLRECVDSSGLGGLCCPRCASQPAYTRSFA